ncbi:MAG TPA: adenylate/guanylate cyclase domain-containing protein, partial [bacterium]
PPAADLSWLRVTAVVGATSLVLLLVVIRVGVQAWERRKGQVTVRYPGARQVTATRGSTVLEMSVMGHIPHASVCGGRGRCSTCRVHIDAGWELLPPASEEEQRVLTRIRAPERVRLACQLRPVADVAVSPLVAANARPRDARPYDRMLFGMEQETVILFSDLRGFTKMSESKLPYDVVHILNQYFAEMGEAIESSGGYLDKFIGDGIMALFGLRDGVQQGALNALAAAKLMAQRLEEMNARLTLDLVTPLKLGIGIHVGHVIVGEMGYKRATSLTAIGDSVNVASRLESATKVAECQLLVSQDVAAKGQADLSAFPLRQLKVRGREEPLRVYIIPTAAELPDFRKPPAQRGGGVVGGVARPA